MRGYLPIADYALIGDCHGSALVARDGAIDWACMARFDKSPAFARLLDAERGGSFTLVPHQGRTVHRRYLQDSNVLETVLEGPSGRARILDAFAMRRHGRLHPHRQLLRVVEGLAGELDLEAVITPRFDFASLRPWLRHHGQGVYSALGGDEALVIQADVPLHIDQDRACLGAQVRLRAGQRCRFTVQAQAPHDLQLDRESAEAIDERLETTLAWWRRWVSKGRYDPEHREAVVRSALVLKLLTCAPTGAIIAAPTTSLPEEIGGQRNWDYRYAWIRDSAHTIAALLAVGHREVAVQFREFILRATAGHVEDLQIVYGCYGERRIDEEIIEGLAGYRGSGPVRNGNGAVKQRQLDVYGELVSAAGVWARAGAEVSDDGWRFLRGVIDAAAREWRGADRGLWEMRGEPRHFVESKVMCWVALERGIAAARSGRLPCDLARWERERDAIRAAIETHGIDPVRGGYVQAFGSREVDASLLLLPLVGYCDARSPAMRATVQAVEEELGDGLLVRRYRPERVDDGVKGGEATFLMGAFWMVEVLAMQGRVDEARARFGRLLALASDVGLMAEEIAPDGELLGNFPQAFSHMALINAAETLRRAQLGEQRSTSARAAWTGGSW